MPKFVQYILLLQGLYYVMTGLWPIVDIRSFEIVSGPKTDIWLVKTVSLLLTTVGITYLISAREKQLTTSIRVLVTSVAGALLFIDVYYNFKGIISDIYLIDGLIQLIFILLWVFYFVRERNS
ncbi:MAG: hypothetical protein K0S32_88 [Bacteroidetes bacterium]|jgi:hypothetical protein|nr:hypothetical protein [Bacteroidota bacterium]